MKKALKTEHIEPREYLLRYVDDVDYSGREEDRLGNGEDGPLYATLKLRKFIIHSKTKCGVWIYLFEHPIYAAKLRFVKLRDWAGETRKRFAHENEQAALKSYVARKNWQLYHLEMQTKRATIGLHLAEALSETCGCDDTAEATELMERKRGL